MSNYCNEYLIPEVDYIIGLRQLDHACLLYFGCHPCNAACSYNERKHACKLICNAVQHAGMTLSWHNLRRAAEYVEEPACMHAFRIATINLLNIFCSMTK